MTEPEQLPYLKKIYPTLPAMLRKFDRFARKRAFMGKSVGEFERWRTETRTLLHELLGTEKWKAARHSPSSFLPQRWREESPGNTGASKWSRKYG